MQVRTQKEIVDKIHEVSNEDWMGTTRNELLLFLDYDHAKEFLKDDVTQDEWGDIKQEYTREVVMNQMKDYLGFAFEKAENKRAFYAGRSMDHYYAWIWLIGEEDHFGDVRNYDNYGIPHLNKIKEFLTPD